MVSSHVEITNQTKKPKSFYFSSKICRRNKSSKSGYSNFIRQM